MKESCSDSNSYFQHKVNQTLAELQNRLSPANDDLTLAEKLFKQYSNRPAAEYSQDTLRDILNKGRQK